MPRSSRTISRRTLLRASGTLAAGLGLSSSAAFAIDPRARAWPACADRRGPVLILFFLRGGVDGLNLVVPYGDAAYAELRPQIAIPAPGTDRSALDLDGFFGLHPAAAPLLPSFKSGDAVAIHAVGRAANTRSHFEEQDVWETGALVDYQRAEGWLNRHLSTSAGRGPIRAVALGGGLPRILRGPAPALAFGGLDELAVGGQMEATMAALRTAYGEKSGRAAEALLADEGRTTLDALRELEAVAGKPYETEVEYPNTDLGRRCREAARLVKAQLGLEVIELDYGGWDTHRNQGAANGSFANLVRNLSQSIAALGRDLGEHFADTLILTLTEFGRTARQNGTSGTDHGWASCLLAAGGPVRAAQAEGPRFVLGEWPGLAPDELNQRRDLRHTTDFRDVAAEVLGRHLRNESVAEVLPAHEPVPVGLI